MSYIQYNCGSALLGEVTPQRVYMQFKKCLLVIEYIVISKYYVSLIQNFTFKNCVICSVNYASGPISKEKVK